MAEVKILDCTLRDGGYINDWHFGYHTIKNILKQLVAAKTDYVEIGFLRDCEYDRDRTLYNNCAEMLPVIPDNHGSTKFVAMALHNKYNIDKLEPYDGKSIEAVRVTFHDYDIDEGLQFIGKVKEKGYKVFCNPINIMGYSDEDILSLLRKVNKIQPYAFSIVDTFGSMMKADLLRIYYLLEHNLDNSIVLGLHLHENLALSYSLAQDFLSIKTSSRESVIDASMLGMGRVPGNLCLELIMDYMNKTQGGIYDVNPILDGIDDYIAKIKEKEPWGYSTAYALSAKYNLHRNYAEFLLSKGRLRAKQINQILASIENEKKTVYDECYIEELYQKYQNREIDDTELTKKLRSNIADKKILILAPGSSLVNEFEKIENFIKREKPLIISANFASNKYKQDYVFCSNAMRYSSLENKHNEYEILVTSNLLDVCDEKNVLNYSDLCFDDKGNCDNCVVMLLKLLLKLGVDRVYIAGFDGYSSNGNNYVTSYMASQHTKGMEENMKNTSYVIDIRKRMEVEFITNSIYDKC